VNWVIYVLSAAAGFANPAQSGANAELKKTLAHPVWATITVYITGLAGMLLIQVFARDAWPSNENFSSTPWWAWTGGLLSIASTMAGLVFAQKLGSGVFTGISITAALASSIVIDHFGLIGFKQHPASFTRIAGCALMVAGLWLVAKF
jgi:transporter family-2 protein